MSTSLSPVRVTVKVIVPAASFTETSPIANELVSSLRMVPVATKSEAPASTWLASAGVSVTVKVSSSSTTESSKIGTVKVWVSPLPPAGK